MSGFLREEVREFVCDSRVVLAKNRKKSLYPHACKNLRTHFSRIFCDIDDVCGITVFAFSV